MDEAQDFDGQAVFGESNTVTVGSVGFVYTTLQAAVSGCETGTVIQIGENMTEPGDVTIPAGKEVTIDLNGKELTMAKTKKIIVQPDGSLNITDSKQSGKLITQNNTDAHPVTESSHGIENLGSLKIENTTVTGAYGVVWNKENASFNMNGGELIVNNTASSSNSRYGAVRNSGGTVRLENVQIDSTMRGISQSAGKMELINTNVTASDTGVDVYYHTEPGESACNIEGGTIDGTKRAINITRGQVLIKGTQVNSYGGHGIAISGGNVTLETASVTAAVGGGDTPGGALFVVSSSTPGQPGAELTVNGGTYETGSEIISCLSVGRPWDYAKISDANLTAPNGTAISNGGELLLENVEASSKWSTLANYIDEDVADEVSKNNGGTDCSARAIINGGNYSSIKSSVIWNQEKYLDYTPKVTINNGTIISEVSNGIYNKGELEVNEGTIESCGDSVTIANENSATATICGGNIISDNWHGAYNQGKMNIGGGVFTTKTTNVNAAAVINVGEGAMTITGGYFGGIQETVVVDKSSVPITYGDGNNNIVLSKETVPLTATGTEYPYKWAGKLVKAIFKNASGDTTPFKVLEAIAKYKEGTDNGKEYQAVKFTIPNEKPVQEDDYFCGWKNGEKIYQPEEEISVQEDSEYTSVWLAASELPDIAVSEDKYFTYGTPGEIKVVPSGENAGNYRYEYQWYVSSRPNEGGKLIGNSNAETYEIPLNTPAGIYYYYCEVKAVKENDPIVGVTLTSKPIKVTISYPYIPDPEPTPEPLPENYPEGSQQKPDGTVETPNGTVIQPDGTITLPDNTELKPTEDGKKPSIEKDGTVTDTNGTTLKPDGTITLPGQDGTKPEDDVTISKGEGTESPKYNPQDGTVTVGKGNVVIQPGNKVHKPAEGSTVQTDGTILIPDGTKITPDGVTHRTDGALVSYDGTVLKPAAPVLGDIKVTGNKCKISLKDKAFGAGGYDFVISKNENCIKDKDYQDVEKNIKGTTTAFTYVSKGHYYVYVHAWFKGADGKKVFGPWSKYGEFDITERTPKAPKIASVKKGKNRSVTITLAPNTSAEGYDIVAGTKVKSANGEKYPAEYGKNVQKNKKTKTITFKNLKKGTYYIGAHAYIKGADGKKVFSKWGNIKKVVIK